MSQSSETTRRMPRWFLATAIPLMAVTAYFYVEVARTHTDTARAIGMVKNFSVTTTGHPTLEETIARRLRGKDACVWEARRVSRLYDTYEVTYRCRKGEASLVWEVGLVNRLFLPKNDAAAEMIEAMRSEARRGEDS
ncbi:MAG: hypothetical protein D6795_13765 [Deltaproteobacteria bacterium]|nr:MAG: hypothetical protein D6795_13765 [Deltaproteobacteria bacterium]